MILTPGQVVLSFLIMISVIGTSGFVFLCELAYKRFINIHAMHYLGISFNSKDAMKKEVKKKEGFRDGPILRINDFFSLKQTQNKYNH